MKKPGIPSVPDVRRPADLTEYLSALQGNLDIVTGRRGGKITPLRGDASLGDVIAKFNELLDRLQA